MMTNPTAALLDDDGVTRFRGSLGECAAYVDGYADAVMEQAWEQYEEDLAQRQAFAEWLDDPRQREHDYLDWDDDDDYNWLDDLPAVEVSLGQVFEADIVEEEQDLTAAYADVTLDAEPSTEPVLVS